MNGPVTARSEIRSVGRKGDIVTRILALLQKALDENVEELTRKQFTGILSVKLDCAFNQGGLRNISKEISQRVTIQKGESL